MCAVPSSLLPLAFLSQRKLLFFLLLLRVAIAIGFLRVAVKGVERRPTDRPGTTHSARRGRHARAVLVSIRNIVLLQLLLLCGRRTLEDARISERAIGRHISEIRHGLVSGRTVVH